jgi:hypothetical protein
VNVRACRAFCFTSSTDSKTSVEKPPTSGGLDSMAMRSGSNPVVSNQSWWYAVAVLYALRLPSSTTAKRKKKTEAGW